MKHKINRFMSILLCFVILAVSALPACAAVTLPEGVSAEMAEESAQKTDILIKNALEKMQGKTLKELVLPMIISDETLNGMLSEIYISMEEQGSSLSNIGIDISPKSVAKKLEAYPDVYARVAYCETWTQVSLDGAQWGVTDEEGFASAVSAMFGVFNELIYTLLCSGSYRMGLVSISGNDGYQNGIVPMLEALGCPNILTNSQFKSQAASEYASMIRNIILSLFSYLDYVLESPCVRLSQTLPNFAYFINNDGLTTSINAIINPLKLRIMNLLPIMSGSSLLSFVENSDSIMTDFSANPMETLNSMLSEKGITLANIDLEKLASCGTLENGKVRANTGEAFCVIFMWLVDSVKLNKDKLGDGSLQLGDMDIGDMSAILDTLLAKGSDEIFALLAKLMTANGSADIEYKWETPSFTKTEVSYTPNLGQEKYQRVLDGIDDLLTQFVKESGEKDIQTVLKRTIYSPDIVSKLALKLYGAVEEQELTQILSVVGIDITPSGVAAAMTENQFSAVKATLAGKSGWSKVKESELNWGFKKGDKKGFKKALTAVLRPLEGVLRMVLVSDKIEILDAISFCGTNGYNSAVIPLLEAIGCPSSKIMTYDELKKNSEGDKIIDNLLTPVFALVDSVIKSPVKKLTEILPNILFFINNGSAAKCIENLIGPIMSSFEGLGITGDSLGLNIEELKYKDILSELSKAVPTLTEDIKLPQPNLAMLCSIGEAVTYQSKAVYQGQPMQLTYVKADQTAVLITLLRYLVSVLEIPENSGLLDSFMSSSDGEDNTFSQFSSGIGDQLAEMSTDETIEWLYKLFFRERVVAESTADQNYDQTIIYEEQKDNSTQKNLATVIIILLTAIIVLLIVFRKKIIYFVTSKSFEKVEKPSEQKEEV